MHEMALNSSLSNQITVNSAPHIDVSSTALLVRDVGLRNLAFNLNPFQF